MRETPFPTVQKKSGSRGHILVQGYTSLVAVAHSASKWTFLHFDTATDFLRFLLRSNLGSLHFGQCLRWRSWRLCVFWTDHKDKEFDSAPQITGYRPNGFL